MGGERSMGGKGAHLGYLGWPAGTSSSRGRAGRRRRVNDEQDRRCASRGRVGEEQRRSRTGGGESMTSRTGGARVGDEQGRSSGGAGSAAASRQRAGLAARESGMSRGGAGLAGGAEPAGRRRIDGGDDQILRGDERMAPRSLLILPRLGLVAARGPGRAGIPPALRFGGPKLAALAFACLRTASTAA